MKLFWSPQKGPLILIGFSLFRHKLAEPINGLVSNSSRKGRCHLAKMAQPMNSIDTIVVDGPSRPTERPVKQAILPATCSGQKGRLSAALRSSALRASRSVVSLHSKNLHHIFTKIRRGIGFW